MYRMIRGSLLLLGVAGTLVVPSPPVAAAGATSNPPAAPAAAMCFPGAEWAVAAPESQAVDPVRLAAAVDHMEATFGRDGARELVIVRNGRLIWAGPEADADHTIYSCTKTFTSTLLGLLVDDGKCSLDDPAVKHLPELDYEHPLYAKIRLRHLASMCGGYRGEVRDKRPDQPWGDVMAYLIPREPAFEAGTHVQYNDHDVFVLGRILTRLAGEPLRDLFHRRIAGPIGIRRWEWGVSGIIDGIALNNPPGNPGGSGAAGVRISPRDLARFGLLMLNRGNWNGQKLLSADFVDRATSNQVPLSAGFRNRDFRGRYGYYWWTNGVMVDGRRPWPSAPPGTYMAHGNGGNFCCVVPEWNLVIARMGSPAPKADQTWEGFFAKLADAILPSGPAKTAPVEDENHAESPARTPSVLGPGATDDVRHSPVNAARRIGDWTINRWAGLDVASDPRDDTIHLVYRDEHTLHYTRSGDRGETWNLPTRIVGLGMHPRLALDRSGTLHLVYCSARSRDPGDRLPDDGYHMQLKGDRWSSPVKLNQPSEGSLQVRIAVDGNDHVHVIYWASGPNRGIGDHERHSCFYRRKPAGHLEFEPALRLGGSVADEFSSHGELAVGPQGEMHVLYRTYRTKPAWTGNLEHRVREKEGAWRNGLVVYRGIYVADFSLAARVDAHGNLHLAAYTFRPQGFRFRCFRSAPTGGLQEIFADDEVYGTSADFITTPSGDLWLVGSGNWSPRSRVGTPQSRIYHFDFRRNEWSKRMLSAERTVNVDIFGEGPRLLQWRDEVHAFYAERGADGKFGLYRQKLTGPQPAAPKDPVGRRTRSTAPGLREWR